MNTIENNRVIKPKVGIAQKLERIKEMLDKDGNIIDPVTKQIIKRNSDNKNE